MEGLRDIPVSETMFLRDLPPLEETPQVGRLVCAAASTGRSQHKEAA